MAKPVPVPNIDDPNRLAILRKLAADPDNEIDGGYVKRAEARVASASKAEAAKKDSKK